ncbi:MAG: porin family protein [Gammaproteobacteria bacterium]|nr:porin family protein [Gammaproteobacteria bacterium]MDH5629799.1 porin family protein [Gammaproteobacteria bacterium]
MKFSNKIGIAALLAVSSATLQAAEFDYDYGQINYYSGDFDGMGVTGSFVVNKEFFVIADYIGVSESVGGFDIDYSQFSIGAGYHMPMSDKTDAVFTVSFVDASVDIPNIVVPGATTFDDTGLQLTAGVRHNLNATFELEGGVRYIDTFNGDSGLYGSARYKINKTMSAALKYSSGDYNDGIGLDFRFKF